MIWVQRLAVNVRPDRESAHFLFLDKRVVAGFADRFRVLKIEEQRFVTLVRFLVVDHCGAGMVTVASDQQAFAALAGVEVADERLMSDAMRTAPALVAVETAVLLSIE